MKNQKGITLVALVITIIVLLILAGVSISLVVGNNGVLSQATNAVNKNNTAAAQQEIRMAVASCYTDFMSAWATNASVEFDTYLRNVNNYVNDGTVTGIPDADTAITDSTEFTYTSSGTGDIAAITFTVNMSTGDVTFN